MLYSIRRPLTLDERNRIGGASDIIAHLLFHRGITDAETAEKFLILDYDTQVHDPFLLKDAEKAATRILEAIKNEERIAIYSDYDADGIPAAVIFNDFFNRIGYKNFSIYIPHRHDEGFGLNIEAVEQLAGEGVKLLITLDCGISDVEPVKHANKLGVTVIITDHHEPPRVLPKAFAIIDHKQDGCEYPDKNLCGSGVGFKFIQAIIKKSKEKGGWSKENGQSQNGILKDGHEKWLLDMVGIATLSDMVPLVGENRVFARYGLSVLRKSPRKGLQKLLSYLKIAQKHLTEDDIAFMITPRINAASRMGVPMDAFNLLSTEDEADAKKFVEHLDAINNERKGTVAALVKEVKKIIKERHGEKMPNVIVMGNPDWRPSLLGLVANTCAEEFNRPVFLWGRDGDAIIKGSCRSGGTVSVVDIMHKVPMGILLQYGGHFASGGFAVSNESIHHLSDHLNLAFDLLLQDHKTIEPKQIDMELSLEKINWALNEDLERLSPFGTGNPKPVFLFKKIKIAGLKHFGKDKNHLELNFKKIGGTLVNAIGFFMNSDQFKNKFGAPLKIGDDIDLVATVEKSMFRGRPELRLRVVDILL